MGVNTPLDDRVFGMQQCKSLPVGQLLKTVYPDLYPVHGIEKYVSFMCILEAISQSQLYNLIKFSVKFFMKNYIIFKYFYMQVFMPLWIICIDTMYMIFSFNRIQKRRVTFLFPSYLCFTFPLLTLIVLVCTWWTPLTPFTCILAVALHKTL